jgi:hypothetical protein
MSGAVVDPQEAAMTRISYLGLIALIPAQAFSQAQVDSADTALQAWTIDELCDAREREDVRDELKRRDLFSSREMRAIRDGEVRTDISLSALICVKGQPDTIVESVAYTSDGPVAAYVHLPDETQGSVAYVASTVPESTVVLVVEHVDPDVIVRNPRSRVLCGGSGRSTRCYFSNNSRYPFAPNADLIVSDDGIPFPGGRCGERLCDADVRNYRDETNMRMPTVPDDAQ